MGKNTNLHKLEQSLVEALAEINILHTGIPFGNHTEEGLEIFDANRVLLGYAKLPLFDGKGLYKQEEVSEKMKIFLNRVFDIFYQRKTYLSNPLKEKYPRKYACHFSEKNLKNSQAILFSGTDLFLKEDSPLAIIKARDEYMTEGALNLFWDDFGSDWLYSALRKMENITVVEINREFWHIYPRFKPLDEFVEVFSIYDGWKNFEDLQGFVDDLFPLSPFAKHKDFLIDELSTLKSYDLISVFSYGEKAEIKKEATRAKKLIKMAMEEILEDSFLERTNESLKTFELYYRDLIKLDDFSLAFRNARNGNSALEAERIAIGQLGLMKDDKLNPLFGRSFSNLPNAVKDNCSRKD